MPGKGSGHLLDVTPADGIGDGNPFIFTQIVVELTYAVYMAVYGLRNLSMQMRHFHKEFSVAMDHYFPVPVY
jgi:hypothetical protein